MSNFVQEFSRAINHYWNFFILSLPTDNAHENFVIENELAESTVNLKILFWTDTKDFKKTASITRGEIIIKVKKQLVENGFSLPSDVH